MTAFMQRTLSLTHFYEDVLKWNAVGGNTLDELDIQALQELKTLYTALVKEETDELFLAWKEQDGKELVDGVCDSLVVTAFLCAVTAAINKEGDNSWKEENLTESEEITYHIKSLTDNIEELIDKGISEAALRVLIDLEDIAHCLDADLESSLKEVMRSNWSKFIKQERKLRTSTLQKECEWIEKERGQEGVTWDLVTYKNEAYYVFKNKDGKIVKPSCFSEPTLTQYIPDKYLKGGKQ